MKLFQECPKVRRKVVLLESCDADNLIRNQLDGTITKVHAEHLRLANVDEWDKDNTN